MAQWEDFSGLLLFFIGIYHPLKTFLSNLYSEGHSATFSDVCFRSNRAKGYVRPRLWHLEYCLDIWQLLQVLRGLTVGSGKESWRWAYELLKSVVRRQTGDKARGRKTLRETSCVSLTTKPDSTKQISKSWRSSLKMHPQKTTLALSCSDTQTCCCFPSRQSPISSPHGNRGWNDGVTKSKSVC